MAPTRLRLAAAGLLIALAAPSCSLLDSGGGYQITAYFEEAVSLYPHSQVKVMGMEIGTVDGVTIDGSGVRVDMTIHDDVPLPANVNATILALTLIGERTVVLSPPWKPGDDRVPDGFVIPVENTTTPVEPDEGLKAFTELIKSIDPTVVSDLVTNGANAFSGHEQSFNDLLGTTATLSSHLAAQDDRIVEAATNLHDLASMLNAREQQLGDVIDGFSDATSLLADEREAIAAALDGAVRLVDAGSSLLSAYQDTLPEDLARLTNLGLTLEANVGMFDDLLDSIPILTQGVINAYDPATGVFRLGANIQPTLMGLFDESLGRILDELGLGNLLPCLPTLNPC